MTTQTDITSLSSLWRGFRRNRMGVVGLLLLLLAIGMAVFAPALAPYDPKAPVKVTIDAYDGTVTFYHHFSREPGGLMRPRVCTGPVCARPAASSRADLGEP